MSFFSSGSVGSYRVVEELGEVPGGEACRAVDRRSGSPVMLKAITRAAPGEAVDIEGRVAEVHRLSRIDRPGIPAVYEVSQTGDTLLLAFAPAPGESLRRFVAGGGRVDRRRLVDWLCRCLELLAEAHSQAVLHRHIGPEAVFIGDDGELALSGFSLTQLAPDAPELQPPEAGEEGGWTAASDLFALGVLFQRLAAPAALGGGADRPLDPGDPLLAALARATAGEPGERFGDAAEMELAIRAAAAEEEPAAPPPPAAPFATQLIRSDHAGGATKGREAAAVAAPAAGSGPRPPAPAPAATGRRSGLSWLLLLTALLLLALGGWWAWRAGLLSRGAQRPAPAPTGREAAGTPPGTDAGTVRTTGARPAALRRQADALEIARFLAAGHDGAAFGRVELDAEDLQLLAGLAADLAALGFEDDPRGGQRARNLFGENPVLSPGNPLVSSQQRERWLAKAIRDLGPERALAHLAERSRALARGEESLAEWYAHAAGCAELCGKVVDGLLYEHLQQVRRRPRQLLLFGRDDAALDAGDRDQLWRFLATEAAEAHLLLVGRSSRSGNRFYNRGLAQRRVAAVEQELLAHGVTAERIHGVWLGYEPPRLTRAVADLYDLEPGLDEGQLDHSVLVVAHRPQAG